MGEARRQERRLAPAVSAVPVMSPRSLSFAEARARVLHAVTPLAPERFPIERAHGRALREDVTAGHALPPTTSG